MPVRGRIVACPNPLISVRNNIGLRLGWFERTGVRAGCRHVEESKDHHTIC